MNVSKEQLKRLEKIEARTLKGIYVHQGFAKNPPQIGDIVDVKGKTWLVFDVYKVDGGWFWHGQDPDTVKPNKLCKYCGKPRFQHCWLVPRHLCELDRKNIEYGQCESNIPGELLQTFDNAPDRELYWVAVSLDFDWTIIGLVAESPCDTDFMKDISS